MFLAAASEFLVTPKLRVWDLVMTPDRLILTAASMEGAVPCSACQQVSARVHSSYVRQISDLPWGVRTVTLRLRVRKFFCDECSCPRKIFAERFDQLVAPYARRTDRLAQRLTTLAFELGGEGGARVAAWLGWDNLSPDTLLRLIRRAKLPVLPTPRCLGVDDWAMKKGQRYGTILCDLERHQVVDLLPSREGSALAAWLQAHPGVEIIARDRSGSYAEGARQGAPDAIQVADRFHLLLNLGNAIKQLVERQPQALKLPPSQPAIAPEVAEPNLMSLSAVTFPAGWQRRQANYEAIHSLRQQGVAIRAIAEQLDLTKNTVLKYAHLPAPPVPQKQHNRLLLPYETFIHQRWQAGVHQAKLLFSELQQEGFSGSYKTVARYVAELRGPQPVRRKVRIAEPPTRQLSVATAVRLLLASPETLDEVQKADLTHLCQASVQIAQAYPLAQKFQEMVRNRLSDSFPQWVEQAQASQAASLRNFAAGLVRDRDAVVAALSLPWSTGPVEGHVNRLKQIKRHMYGRGQLDLLKQRVLYRGHPSPKPLAAQSAYSLC